MIRFGMGSLAALAVTACAPQMQGAGSIISVQQAPEAAAHTSGDADAFHESIAVFDSHLDTPALFHTADYVFTERGTWEEDGTHVDLPRMNEGGLDGGFWVIFTRQGPLDEASYAAARTHGLMRQAAIREFAAKYHDEVALAFTATDAERILADGKKVVFQSMENSYPLGLDVSLLEHFYIGGLRMIAPVHFANNQFADSATDIEPIYDGLSPLGEDLVREANRLGLVLDGSHAADATVRDMLALSTTPIILSHTGAKAVYDHPRNIDDALLQELAAAGGVIQMNIFGGYLETLVPSPERQVALEVFNAAYGENPSGLDDEALAAWFAARQELDRDFPRPRSTYEKFMEHTFHVLELIGPDHVGISGDWDGGGGVDGMSDVSMLQKITHDLLEAGFTHEDVEKIWGGNMMRLVQAAEDARTSELISPDVLN
ncbi:MAG: membrane dipeptidase [Hyphomonadaceae bacterium]|nr:membrane dipeptidase [Hyphomonadaceae bacterium]